MVDNLAKLRELAQGMPIEKLGLLLRFAEFLAEIEVEREEGR